MGSVRTPRVGRSTISIKTSIAPAIAEFVGKLRVKLEAPAGEGSEWGAVAPVEGQKTAGFSRRCTSNLMPLDKRHVSAFQAQIVGKADADNTTATDRYAHG